MFNAMKRSWGWVDDTMEHESNWGRGKRGQKSRINDQPQISNRTTKTNKMNFLLSIYLPIQSNLKRKKMNKPQEWKGKCC